MNFRNYADNPTWDAMSGKPQENASLVSQSSIYSLTFDELQNTIGGMGKDFGSMNMDELLKNIWTAEETQGLAASSATGLEGHNNPTGNLQRQGSLTLPRTLSQKTVDEVWKDLIKDGGGAKDSNGNGNCNVNGNDNGGSAMPQTQRQPTLGEITLEEFLVRAGVVREDMPQAPQQIVRPNTNGNGWFSEFSRSNNNNTTSLLGFQQANQNNENFGERNMVETNNLAPKHLPLPSNHSQRQQQQQQQQQQQHHHQPPPLFPKPTNVAFTSPIHLLSNAQLANPGRRGGMIGVQEHPMNGTLVQNNAVPGMGMLGLATANVNAPGASPRSKFSPDVITKHNADPSSLSPVPYVINRGRKGGAVEKVVERRQRRMIKNRESAARSRARKQAYTIELEAEVAKLKELNEELQRKQAEFMEMQKNKDTDQQRTNKRQHLRRTLTGPW